MLQWADDNGRGNNLHSTSPISPVGHRQAPPAPPRAHLHLSYLLAAAFGLLVWGCFFYLLLGWLG